MKSSRIQDACPNLGRCGQPGSLKDPHYKFVLLRLCFLLLKIMHIMRTIDPSSIQHLLSEFDNVVTMCLLDILGSPLGHKEWHQHTMRTFFWSPDKAYKDINFSRKKHYFWHNFHYRCVIFILLCITNAQFSFFAQAILKVKNIDHNFRKYL